MSINSKLQIIAADRRVISTILFQQIMFHWTLNNQKEFYKYKEPCQSRYYQDGESWVEILGFTRHEFDSALKKLVDLGVVSTRIDIERKTWYSLNNEKVVAIFGGVK